MHPRSQLVFEKGKRLLVYLPWKPIVHVEVKPGF